ncbi:MAG: pyridine nucleotide-disulfide oxidoreductase [Pirellula sp.]|nr:pyridine nucleotide-disulfide oxidoreductase [Pirellula sp.]
MNASHNFRLAIPFALLIAVAVDVSCAKAAATANRVDGKSYDLVVVGATPGGIACAVRAAREGLSVLLVQHNRHIGGMLTNGLCQWDALYAGHRAPLFNEFAGLIEQHYLRTYGAESPQYRLARFTQTHYPMSRFEPSVAEREFDRLVAAEKNLTLLLEHYPSAAQRDGGLLRGVTLRAYGGTKEINVRAGIFADGTYEGDLAALAKVPYRVGRESREEYGEPHAGKVFCNLSSKAGPRDAVEGRLNLHPYRHSQGTVDPTSPHTADGAIQAYNYRFCLSGDPSNRRLPEKPPGYDRNEYLHYNRLSMNSGALNGKGTFNSAILPGENHAYPDADWPTREKIIERHKNFALGLMYFLQNDESVSKSKQAAYRKIGLPLDEYADNDNLPYEMYVREARRIVGRYIFKEQDNSQAPGITRPPIHGDSVAITDWSMDSHDCTTDRRPGYAYDGKLILTEESRPAQIPYRSLLPQGVDNLLVPVCLSATHVAWGAVRLEPVWMQTGEAAGFAAALAKQQGTTPGRLDPDLLLRTLVERRMFVSFFNDVTTDGSEPWIPAVQYFGTKGFFPDYDARSNAPLTSTTATQWSTGLARLASDQRFDAMQIAQSVAKQDTDAAAADSVTVGEFAQMLRQSLITEHLPAGDVDEAMKHLKVSAGNRITRGDACRLMFAVVEIAARSKTGKQD